MLSKSPTDMEDKFLMTCEAFRPNQLDTMTNVGYEFIKKGYFDFDNLKNSNNKNDNIFNMLDYPEKPYKNEKKHKVPSEARPEIFFRNKSHVNDAT